MRHWNGFPFNTVNYGTISERCKGENAKPVQFGSLRLCHGLDLAQDTLGQILDSNAAAGGLGGEVLCVDLVEGGKVGDIGYDKVIKTTCFLADIADFAAFNEVYARYFTSKPARSCVAVKELPKGVLCEIEAIAVK